MGTLYSPLRLPALLIERFIHLNDLAKQIVMTVENLHLGCGELLHVVGKLLDRVRQHDELAFLDIRAPLKLFDPVGNAIIFRQLVLPSVTVIIAADDTPPGGSMGAQRHGNAWMYPNMYLTCIVSGV